jgi:iron complex outermembrane receptor protein
MRAKLAASHWKEGTSMKHGKLGPLCAAATAALVSGQMGVAHAQVPVASSAPPPPANASAPPTEGSGDIIVTAQKRRQRLQDVPSSVSVVSATALEQKGGSGLADLTKSVSGLQLIGGSTPGTGKPTIRGISSGADRVALVGIYLDDVAFTSGSPRTTAVDGRALAFDPAFADIDHIEVLKGPQSTLYGASTVGGLIKYVSKLPDPTHFEGSARVGGSQIDGGGGGYSTRLSVNIPISDNMAVRASAFYRNDPGYVTEISRGNKDANQGTAKGFRASLLYQSGDFQNVLTGFVQQIHSNGSSDVFLTPSLSLLNNEPSFSSPIRQDQNYKYVLVANTSTLKLPFATITNVASYNGVFSRQVADYSVLTGDTPDRYARAYEPNNNKRLSDEFRVASTPGRFEWLLGAYYTHEHLRSFNTFRGTDENGTVLPSSDPLFNLYNLNNLATFQEYAVFGNATYHLTSKLEATVGVRYSKDKDDFSAIGFGLISNSVAGFPTNDSNVDYLATISYKPSSSMTLYARAASGFRPGGPNNFVQSSIAAGAPPSFKADKLWNYEAGIKGSLLDRHVNYEAAVYHMDWTDIQVTQSFPLAGGGSDTGVANAGKAKSDGAEASITAQPSDQLSFGVNASYNHARVTANAPNVGAVSGDPLPYAPKFSTNLFADYRPHITDNINGLIGATYTFRGRQKAGFENSPTPQTLPHYNTLDLRAGLEWDRYRVDFTVDNVTNSHAITYVNNLNYKGGPLGGYTLRPRTYGLAVEVKF